MKTQSKRLIFSNISVDLSRLSIFFSAYIHFYQFPVVWTENNKLLFNYFLELKKIFKFCLGILVKMLFCLNIEHLNFSTNFK